ncbi:hypothetical protein [Aquimarina sp. RZ0]|uniref:hypothetical protein n=1 Tax=Aquimarina sp. RZ0 TaxID=2607730 RepID=UPI00165FBCDE|nr:hypothetical protein [Aquimarina sp. RZ0]
MNNNQNKTKLRKLSVAYVFSKDNQVYIKNDTYTELIIDSSDQEEWFPVNFRWKTS